MSEYKWSDPDSWDTFCYVEKGSEKLGFFQTYLELKDLERKLEEAREYLIQASEADWTEELNDYVKQLKEQG